MRKPHTAVAAAARRPKVAGSRRDAGNASQQAPEAPVPASGTAGGPAAGGRPGGDGPETAGDPPPGNDAAQRGIAEQPPDESRSTRETAGSPDAGSRPAGLDPPQPPGSPHQSTQDSDGRGTPGGESGSAPAGRDPILRRLGASLRRPRVLLPTVLIAALLATTGYLGVRVRDQSALETARADALHAARDYATDLSTYDHGDLDGNFAAVTANSTGPFAAQYRQVSANLTELIKQNKAVSRGTVQTAGVAQASPDRAVVTLFVDQEITNTNNPQPRIDRNRMQMSLVRQDARWLVDDIKLL